MPRALGLHSRTGTAVAVALDGDRFAGRWDLDLTEESVPDQVWHAVADLPLDEAEAVAHRAIETVVAVATSALRTLLDEAGGVDVVAVVMGDFPVPDSAAAILASHTLMHAAEGQLYREALLDAAAALGLPAVGVSRNLAASRLDGDLAAAVARLGAAAGRPWRKEHKLAAIAALTALTESG
jgi:hypothetical protein